MHFIHTEPKADRHGLSSPRSRSGDASELRYNPGSSHYKTIVFLPHDPGNVRKLEEGSISFILLLEVVRTVLGASAAFATY